MMSNHYRLWYVKRGEKVQGPFPEKLICRFVILGRVGDQDLLSIDAQNWRKQEDIPELLGGIKELLRMRENDHAQDSNGWAEERAKSAMRWLDDRKAPDPRLRHAVFPNDRREGGDRRKNPETMEQLAYREERGEFESWLRRQHQRLAPAALGLIGLGLVAVLIALVFRPVNPVKVGLSFEQPDCEAPAVKGVNWSACAKDHALLLGADLRGAELVGTSLKEANLRYADLTGANLLDADLTGANLDGARLDGAVWIDGRICAEASIGSCK